MLQLEAKWTAIEKEYTLKLEDLSNREIDLTKRYLYSCRKLQYYRKSSVCQPQLLLSREEVFLKRETSQRQDWLRRLHDVEGREGRAAGLELELSRRQNLIVEGKETLSRAKSGHHGNEHSIITNLERLV